MFFYYIPFYKFSFSFFVEGRCKHQLRIETDNRGFPFIFLSAKEVRSLSLTASLDRYGKEGLSFAISQCGVRSEFSILLLRTISDSNLAIYKILE